MGKFIVLNVYVEIEEWSPISRPQLHVKKVEKKIKPKVSRKGNNKNWSRNQLNRKPENQIDKPKACSLRKNQWNLPAFSQIDLREKTQITNIRNERGGITTDPTDIKRITKIHYK